MKKYLYHFAFLTCLSLIFFTSCSKDSVDKKKVDKENPAEDDPCVKMDKFKIEPVAPVLLRTQIRIYCDTIEDANYSWTGPREFSSYDQNPLLANNANLYMEGWYHVEVTHASCKTVKDSVYVDVHLRQGTPDCKLTNNEIDFDGTVAKVSPVGITYIGEGIAGFLIEVGGSYFDMNMFFSDYWVDHELEDGIYYTTNGTLPKEEDQVSIRVVTRNLSFSADANHPVYISHVNGKVRVSFCIPVTDTHGYAIKTTMSGQITED